MGHMSEKRIDNSALHRARGRQTLVKRLKYAGAVAILAGMGAGYLSHISSEKRDYREMEDAVQDAPWTQVDLGNRTLSDCYDAERAGRDDFPKYEVWRRAVLERNNDRISGTVELPQLTGTGCGE